MQSYEVSVILPFHDDEEIIGSAVADIARYLRDRTLRFEIIAVDDDSGDNSQAVLALVRKGYPELKVTSAPSRGRGYEWGSRAARGRVLWLLEPRATLASLEPFAHAYERVLGGQDDLLAIEQRFMVAHRARCMAAILAARGRGRHFQQRLLRRARQRGLDVDTSPRPQPSRFTPRWAAPLLAALSFSRTS